jgi:hypothetical protein
VWVPYLNAGAAQINFEQLQWPIDKDVSIRQLGVLLITLKVVGTRKSFIHRSNYEQRHPHKRAKENTVVYKCSCKFSMQERCHKGLGPACREIFLKLWRRSAESSPSKPFLEITWRLRSLCHHGMKNSGAMHGIFVQSKTLYENSSLKRYSKFCTASPTASRCRA